MVSLKVKTLIDKHYQLFSSILHQVTHYKSLTDEKFTLIHLDHCRLIILLLSMSQKPTDVKPLRNQAMEVAQLFFPSKSFVQFHNQHNRCAKEHIQNTMQLFKLESCVRSLRAALIFFTRKTIERLNLKELKYDKVSINVLPNLYQIINLINQTDTEIDS